MKKVRVVLICIALLVFLGAALMWPFCAEQLADRVRLTVVEEVGGALNGELKIDAVTVNSFYGVTVHGITVCDEAGVAVLTVARADVSFNPLMVINGFEPAAAIKEIKLDRLEVALRRQADSKWNVDNLLRSTERDKALSFKGVISADNASVKIYDGKNEYGLSDIDLSATPIAGNKIKFSVDGKFKNEKFSAEGAVRDIKNFFGDIKIARVYLPELQSFLPVQDKVQLNDGIAEDIKLIARRERGELVYGGEASFSGLAVTANDMKVTNASGTIVLNRDEVYLQKCRGKFQEQEFKISGKFGIGAGEPTLDAEFGMEQLDLSSLGLPLQGRSAVNVRATGFISAPSLKIQATGSGLQFEDKELSVFSADLHVDRFNKDSLNAASVSGMMTATGVHYNGMVVDRLTMGFKHRDITEVDFVNLDIGAGNLSARGTVVGERLNFTALGHGISLDRFSSMASTPLSGNADVQGTIVGTIKNPLISGSFVVKDGAALNQAFERAEGQVRITPQRAVLEKVVISQGSGSTAIEGTIGLTGNRDLDLSAVTQSVRAESLLASLLPDEKITGNVSNRLIIKGTTANPEVRGRLQLERGSFRGKLVMMLEGGYRYIDGALYLDDFAVRLPNTTVKLGGRVHADKSLDIGIVAQNIDLAQVVRQEDYPVTGIVNFKGQLTGTIAEPLFAGQIKASTITLNGQAINNIETKVRIDKETVHINEFSFRQNAGTFMFTGGLVGDRLYGSAAVDDISLKSILAIFNSPFADFDGNLSGTVGLGGVITNPEIGVEGSLRNGRLKDYPLDSVDLNILLSGGIIRINNFMAKQGKGILAVRGSADLNGDIDIEVGGNNIDAGLLTIWTDSKTDASGKLTFSAEVAGKTMDPHIAMSLQIDKGRLLGAEFDSLYGLFIMEKQNIRVDQVMLIREPYKASIYGSIPLAALEGKKKSQTAANEGMNLIVTLDKANLSILPMLSNEAEWGTGETKGRIVISGTLHEPLINGQVAVQDGTVKLKSLAQPIKNIKFDLQMTGNNAFLKSCSGDFGTGNIQMSGKAEWSGLDLKSYNLDLDLNKPIIEHRYFKGPLQGKLKLSSVNGKPHLSGNLLFEDVTVNIPLIPQLTSTGMDVGLDLEVSTGKKVRLYNSYLYDLIVEGKAVFSGTTLEPKAAGRFSAVRGTIKYLRTPFKIRTAQVDFAHANGIMPKLHLEATARLEKTIVNLAVHGSITEMDVKLTSTPSMNQQQIMALLTLGSSVTDKGAGAGSGNGRDEMVGLLEVGLQMQFVNEVEAIFRKALNIDEFRISQGSINSAFYGFEHQTPDKSLRQSYYNVALSKYVTDKLSINYTRGLDKNEYVAGFRYDVKNNVSLTGTYDNEKRKRFGVEMRFTF